MNIEFTPLADILSNRAGLAHKPLQVGLDTNKNQGDNDCDITLCSFSSEDGKDLLYQYLQ